VKNIQVIDDALNCLFEVFSVPDEDFELIFPEGRDIEFSDDFVARVGESQASAILERCWEHIQDKKQISGIHGTLFYGAGNGKRKPFFPTRREAEMVALPEKQ
jgi:hypothetical protein